MKRNFILTLAAFTVAIFCGGLSANAQVKRVQMHIGGYLCGN